MQSYNSYLDTVDSTAVSKGACTHCPSSDANVLFSDGHHYCFSCNTYTPPDGSDTKDYSMNQVSRNTN